MLRYLISKCKVDVNKTFDNDGKGLLLQAVRHRQEDIALYLIKEAGADINVQAGGLTVFHLAIMSGMLNLVKYLILEKHVKFLPACKDSYRAISAAARSDHVETVMFLMEHFGS